MYLHFYYREGHLRVEPYPSKEIANRQIAEMGGYLVEQA